jgi:xanthine dehydrogenase accessory factor
VEGSSSARRGSKAIIDADGKLLFGWIGGGCAESAVRSETLRCLELGEPLVITLDMTDELLGVGMPCGGKMDVYIEPVMPKPELLIAGHGRIAETLAALAHMLGFRIIVNDPGADQASFPQAERVIAEDFDLNQTPIGPNTYVVIATQHKNDHRWLQRALEGDAVYVALVASQHRAKLVLDYLGAEGVPAGKLASEGDERGPRSKPRIRQGRRPVRRANRRLTLPVGYRECALDAEPRASPVRFRRSETISAIMLSAISSGVLAPISSPAGTRTPASFPSAIPLSRRPRMTSSPRFRFATSAT